MEEQSELSVVNLVLVNEQEYIWIVIHDTVLRHFFVRRSENFGLILKRFLELTGNQSAKFIYNGRNLRDDDTPASLNMGGGASIGKSNF